MLYVPALVGQSSLRGRDACMVFGATGASWRNCGVDFLAVVEHRLVPAGVRSEWARLRCKKMASIWAPASQEACHVGHAGVGVVSLRGAPLSLPSIATAQFQRFFLIVVGLFGVCFHWVVVGLCIWLFFMAVRGLIVILSGLL